MREFGADAVKEYSKAIRQLRSDDDRANDRFIAKLRQISSSVSRAANAGDEATLIAKVRQIASSVGGAADARDEAALKMASSASELLDREMFRYQVRRD